MLFKMFKNTVESLNELPQVVQPLNVKGMFSVNTVSLNERRNLLVHSEALKIALEVSD